MLILKCLSNALKVFCMFCSVLLIYLEVRLLAPLEIGDVLCKMLALSDGSGISNERDLGWDEGSSIY